LRSAVTQINRKVYQTWYKWPAAAVIPAPIAYIKVVAVKKLVVEFWTWLGGLCECIALLWLSLSFWRTIVLFI
jgi:hypothetical protein